MIETTFQANGNYKERENEFVSYDFVINNEYKKNGFPALKITQKDDSEPPRDCRRLKLLRK